MDAGPEVNSKQPPVGDEYAVGGIRLQTLLPPPDRGRYLPELPATSRASCLLPPEPSTSSRAFNCLQTSRPLRLHAYTTSIPAYLHTCTPSRPLDLCGSMPTRPPYVHDLHTCTASRPPYLHAFQTSTPHPHAPSPQTQSSGKKGPGTAMAGKIACISRMVGKSYITSRKRRSMPGRR